MADPTADPTKEPQEPKTELSAAELDKVSAGSPVTQLAHEAAQAASKAAKAYSKDPWGLL
jgi:hypothetical protein